ncbi:hypothetical protein H0H81_010556 [Sphagnurus paluster]|uniref:Uncharacterized protein n=1 Tax=Sphagnurus paluster TaxID=117069 RepID=A0A9P7K8G1_9AGAR|nr:hypothetical protein H0H81_010556 [Sphagnurus paluster]
MNLAQFLKRWSTFSVAHDSQVLDFLHLVFVIIEDSIFRRQAVLDRLHDLSLVSSSWKRSVDLYLPPRFLRPLVYSPFDEHVFDLAPFLTIHNKAWIENVYPTLYLDWFELRQHTSWGDWRHEFVVAGFKGRDGQDYALQLDHGWDAPAGGWAWAWQEHIPLASGSVRGKNGSNEVTLLRGACAQPGRVVPGVRTVCTLVTSHTRGPGREPLLALLDEIAFLADQTPRYSLTGINCWAWARYLLYWAVFTHPHAAQVTLSGVSMSRADFLRTHATNTWFLRVTYARSPPTPMATAVQTLFAALAVFLPPAWGAWAAQWYTRWCVWDTIRGEGLWAQGRARCDSSGLAVSTAGLWLGDADSEGEVDGFPQRLAAVDLPLDDAVETMLEDRFVSDWNMPAGNTMLGCAPIVEVKRNAREERDIRLYRALSSPGALCYIVCPLARRPKKLLVEVCFEVQASGTGEKEGGTAYAALGLVREPWFGSWGPKVVASQRLVEEVLIHGKTSIAARIHKWELTYDTCEILRRSATGDKLCIWVGAEQGVVNVVYGATIDIA